MLWIRISKIVLVALAASYASLVAFNNLTDYGSNFQFVQHVLSMDTTFPDNSAMWRAVTSPVHHHAAYILIITVELLVAIIGWLGAIALWQSRQDVQSFNQKKSLAGYALILGISLWFGGFIVVGGEWFLMWQSEVWNGIQAAFRVTMLFAVTFVILISKDSDYVM
jgi:predicted small integral membrane protein